ncbi:MAG: transcription elongation factor GreAB [Opitutae bacterium]|nr:transcription elongation factor GreAB [Opitutae bacterium]|tara:strand:- start:2884 stop:4749 length:1866 start_codon:yes stop_codon:yes gene_type:complete
MNKEVIDSLIDDNPELADQREALEAMQDGSHCIHRSWGFGQIQSFDSDQGKLIIDFEDGEMKGHAMDPVFCLGKLEVLSGEHILSRSRSDAETIEQMVKKDQVGLVIEILSSTEDFCASTREMERILLYLLGPVKAKKWWTNVKKQLVKDPRIAVPNKKSDVYVLRDEPKKPEDEVLEEFHEAQTSKEKILLAEKLLELSADKQELKNNLPAVLTSLTQAIIEAKRLTLAERLYGVWIRNNLARDVEDDVDVLEPTSGSVLEEVEDFSELADELPVKFQSRFLDLLERAYPEDWKEKIIDIFRKSNGKITAECAHFLTDHELQDELLKSLQSWLNEQKIKASVLLWMIKNRESRKFKEMLAPLIGPRLVTPIFSAIDHEALHNPGTRRIPLAEILLDDEDLMPDLLSEADLETAKDLAQTLILNQGFEDLSKKSLLARFIKRFPEIQSLLETDGTVEEKTVETIFVSQPSLDKMKKDLEILVSEKIPANSDAIGKALELGDLRENAEYQMAKDEQKILLARRSEIEQSLTKAQVTDFSDTPTDHVGIGSAVKLFDETTEQDNEYVILGAWDGDPEKNIISYQTPLGQSLLQKKVGEVVETEVEGEKRSWKIMELSRWIDRN